MIQKWEPNLFICPLNKETLFLINHCGKMYECVGTLTTNMHTGGIIRGEFLEGDSDAFYKGTFLAWLRYI